MTVRVFIVGSLLAAIAGWGALTLVVTQLDPDRAGASGFILFFLSLFVGLASVVGLSGYAARRIVMRHVIPIYAVRTSLRQGVITSIFASVILFLQLLRLYRWWIAIILLAACIFIELMFLSFDRGGARASRPPVPS